MKDETKKELRKPKIRYWKVWIIFWKPYPRRILLRSSDVSAVIRSLTGCMMMDLYTRDEHGG